MTCVELGAKNPLLKPEIRYVCAIRADIGPATQFDTNHGTTRAMFPITGGQVLGQGWSGEILPGGADFALGLPDGSYAIEARYCIEMTDGTVVMVTNAGRMYRQSDGSYLGRTRAAFEAPAGAFGWLADAVFFGTAMAEAGDEDHVFIELWQALL